LEARTVEMLFTRLVAEFANKHVDILVDARSVAEVLNRGRTRSVRVRSVVAQIYELAAQHNIFFKAHWVPRECNLEPDALTECADDEAARDKCAELGLSFCRL